MNDAPHTYHALYLAVHAAHAAAPHIWTNHHCTRLLTSIMSSKPFSWRVIGITKEALKTLQQLNYRYKSGEGLTRAHLRPRIETVQELLNRDEPMSEYDFIEYWLTHDRTVICAKGENRPTIVDFIPIENPHGSLFSSNSVAWKHGKAECDLLGGRHVPTSLGESGISWLPGCGKKCGM
jgi:hypothetical protein